MSAPGIHYSEQGPHEFSEMRVAPSFEVVTFTYADLASNIFKHVVNANDIVLGVALEIVTAFNVAAAVIVGDASDDNGYIVTAVVDPTVAGSYFFSQGGAGALTGGKKYASASTIEVKFDDTPTAGKAKLHILKYSTKGNWRVPDL